MNCHGLILTKLPPGFGSDRGRDDPICRTWPDLPDSLRTESKACAIEIQSHPGGDHCAEDCGWPRSLPLRRSRRLRKRTNRPTGWPSHDRHGCPQSASRLSEMHNLVELPRSISGRSLQVQPDLRCRGALPNSTPWLIRGSRKSQRMRLSRFPQDGFVRHPPRLRQTCHDK